jgi:hypothetical protein
MRATAVLWIPRCCTSNPRVCCSSASHCHMEVASCSTPAEQLPSLGLRITTVGVCFCQCACTPASAVDVFKPDCCSTTSSMMQAYSPWLIHSSRTRALLTARGGGLTPNGAWCERVVPAVWNTPVHTLGHWLSGRAPLALRAPPKQPTRVDIRHAHLLCYGVLLWRCVICSQGWPNDYCRWVSINGTSAFWSCALAGGNNQYSPANMFSESTTYSVPCAPGEGSVVTVTATPTTVSLSPMLRRLLRLK